MRKLNHFDIKRQCINFDTNTENQSFEIISFKIIAQV